MKNNKGFIQIPILIAIVVGVILVSGASYIGIDQYRKKQGANIVETIQQQKTQQQVSETEIDTDVEIEKLKKEIEELKKQPQVPASAQAEVQTKPTQPVKNYDQEISQYIAGLRQYIDVFNTAIQDGTDLIFLIRGEMSKYPNDFSVQQSGEDVIDESNNFISITKKLIDIENEMINKLSSYKGLNIEPPASEFSSFTSQYNLYYDRYEASIDRRELLINTFVLNERSAVERATREVNQQIEDLRNSQSYTPPVYTDPQIEAALSDLQATLSNIENELISTRVMDKKKEQAVQDWMRQNPSVFSYPDYINQFNTIINSFGLYYMAIIQ